MMGLEYKKELRKLKWLERIILIKAFLKRKDIVAITDIELSTRMIRESKLKMLFVDVESKVVYFEIPKNHKLVIKG